MIFRLTLFAVLGLDADLDQYAIIHYAGSTSLPLYSKWTSRKFVGVIKNSRELAGMISKEELLAIEDAISNSRLQEEICAKDMREVCRGAIAKLDEIFSSMVMESAEKKPEIFH